jgi:hypothetical protein
MVTTVAPPVEPSLGEIPDTVGAGFETEGVVGVTDCAKAIAEPEGCEFACGFKQDGNKLIRRAKRHTLVKGILALVAIQEPILSRLETDD